MDARAIEGLYRAHGHVVLRRARGLLGNSDDASDVLQEVFASLVDRPGQFRGDASVTTWLYAATTHGCLNRIRNRKTRERVLAERSPPSDEARAPAIESRAILRDLLARLPDELAQAAVYYYADEMTHDEIAVVLGCSRRHVGDLIERMHQRLEESR